MELKAVFIVFAVLSLIGSSLADSSSCPAPEHATTLAYKGEVHIEAATFGRVEKTVTVPFSSIPKGVSCVVLTGFTSAGPSGSVSIASIGLSGENFAIKLVSQIKEGIDVGLELYSN